MIVGTKGECITLRVYGDIYISGNAKGIDLIFDRAQAFILKALTLIMKQKLILCCETCIYADKVEITGDMFRQRECQKTLYGGREGDS